MMGLGLSWNILDITQQTPPLTFIYGCKSLQHKLYFSDCSAKYQLYKQSNKVTKMQHLTVVGYCSNSFAAAFLPMVSYFRAVLIICGILSVEYLLLMQCYKIDTLQHLIEAK